MARKSPTAPSQKRKPRLLWANPFCLLDTSSGASISVRQMLQQLVANGYDVQVLGATVFDDKKGMGQLRNKFPDLGDHLHQLIKVDDGLLSHHLVVTQRSARQFLTTHEERLWYVQYTYMLDNFKPDVVWFYGGQTLELLIPDEARSRGIPSVSYLVNSNYKTVRWCRDVDLIVTDTKSTSDMYRRSIGFSPHPVGKFIDPEQFVAKQHARKFLLFVNPSWEKGASVFVQLAAKLERERPDISLEVVESRSDWSAVLRETTRKLGMERSSLSNVTVTPNTNDMREPYSRARVLIAPSLWWESGARVLAESMLNGIPAIVSDSGGNREMVGEGGITINLPDACFEKPYQHLLSDDEIQPLFDTTVAFFDDEDFYQYYVVHAKNIGDKQHHIHVSTGRLVSALSPLVNQRAGSKDFIKVQRRRHKHKIAGALKKPELRPLPTSAPESARESTQSFSVQGGPAGKKDNLDWEIESKVVVLDNRAKLIKTGAADELAKTNAFAILSFDPASEVINSDSYEDHECIQLFQHALLGDGQPSKLNACLDATFSSTLTPMNEEVLPEHRRQGTKVLAQLPINTIALDSIEGLPSLDWLILDELSDAVSILKHGEQVLKSTLLLQVRVAFQPTHAQQPSLTELQHWAGRNGFCFYRFNDMHYHSFFDQPIFGGHSQASCLESADVLFLPASERLEHMESDQLKKLAFILHLVFGAHDAAYKFVCMADEELASGYLQSIESVKSVFNKKESIYSSERLAEGSVYNQSVSGGFGSESESKVLVSGRKVF